MRLRSACGPVWIALLLLALTARAHADQFREAADNATVEGFVSSIEVSRISLVGDRVASVQKIKSADYREDFTVAHDAITGDIYVTLSPAYLSKFVNFFVTSKQGYTYKFMLQVKATPGTQIFVRNPLIASDKAQDWETGTPLRRTAIRLIRAMWNAETVPGYAVTYERSKPRRSDRLKTTRVAAYDGARLTGHVFELENRMDEPLDLKEDAFAFDGAVALSLRKRRAAPDETVLLYVVTAKGAGR
ncbi:MAG: type-F conjugative transfer system secretin TraK [bacterium]